MPSDEVNPEFVDFLPTYRSPDRIRVEMEGSVRQTTHTPVVERPTPDFQPIGAEAADTVTGLG